MLLLRFPRSSNILGEKIQLRGVLFKLRLDHVFSENCLKGEGFLYQNWFRQFSQTLFNLYFIGALYFAILYVRYNRYNDFERILKYYTLNYRGEEKSQWGCESRVSVTDEPQEVKGLPISF